MIGVQADDIVMVAEAEAPALYTVPAEPLRLSGPVARPAPGTLPLRGDLAHIALAQRYLVQNYVNPARREVGPRSVSLRLHPSEKAEAVAQLPAASSVEKLDEVGEWVWVCCGPNGPTGYLHLAELAPAL